MEAAARRRLVRLAGPLSVAIVGVVAVMVVVGRAGEPRTFNCSPTGDPQAPRVSAPSGFYDVPFELSVTWSGSDELVYTLDGSYPDEHRGARYEGPIRIEDRTGEPLRAATVRTAISMASLERLELPDPQWDRAPADTPQATVVRLRHVDGPECVAVYFVGAHHRRPAMPVVHLATDHEHLFDHHDGIYVPGAHFADHLIEATAEDPRPWFRRPANYHRRGRDWERPKVDEVERSIVLHWFEPDGSTFASNVGLRIHGGATRAYPMKSLRLYARNDYGTRTFDHDFFRGDAPESPRRLLLRSSGNDCVCLPDLEGRTHFADAFFHELASGLDLDTQAYRPVVLYLNGEYWGIHNLRERLDEHYLEQHHGINASRVELVEHSVRLDVSVPAGAAAAELIESLVALRHDERAALALLEQHVDLDNLLDYVAVQVYSGNTDWPVNNWRMWRVTDGSGRLGEPDDGRWRFMLFDLDLWGDRSGTPEADLFSRLLADREWDGTQPLWQLLVEAFRIEETRVGLALRLTELLARDFAPARAHAVIDAMVAGIVDEMDLHLARWVPDPEALPWDEERHVGPLRRFVDERPDVLREQVATLLSPA